jgi:phosphoribosylglycinamide formyltransferase-1
VTLKLGVLVSGSGSNLQAILDACANKSLDASVELVLSNKPGVYALERAARAGVATAVLSHKDFSTREAFDAEVVRLLRARSVDTVALAGFMRIVTPTLLDAFASRVINVHPALLPSFVGVDAQRQALDYGAKITGCTVHFVDAGTDTGPIIAQAAVPVLEDDTVEALRARVLVEEHRLLPLALQWLAEGRLSIDGRRVRVRPLAHAST